MKKILFIGCLCLSMGMRAMENTPSEGSSAAKDITEENGPLVQALHELIKEVRHVAEAQEEATTLQMLLFLNLKGPSSDKNGTSSQESAEKLLGAMLAKRGLKISTTSHSAKVEENTRDSHEK